MMPLASLVHLSRVRLRARLAQELLALAGIAVGVALVFAALVAAESLTGSVRQLTSGIVGETRFQLAARGPEGFSQRLLADVRRLDGVRAAAPILETRANVIGPDGRRSVLLVGGDPRFARIGGPLLRTFTASALARQRAIALPAPMAAALGLAPYQPVRVETAAGTTTAPLGAELQAAGIGALVHSPVAIAPLAFAQAMSGLEGKVSRIFVAPEPGRDAAVAAGLRRLAGDRLNVRDARHDVAVFEQAAAPTNQSTAMFSLFSALVGFLFAFSAVLLTVPQRRRLVGDMRLAGYEPSAQLQVLLFDALVLGVAGAGLGIALGDQLSRHVLGTAPGYLADAFPVGEQRIVTARSVAIAGAAGVVAACVAVLAPLREIVDRRVAPDAARVPRPGTRSGRGTLVAGLVCVAVTTLIVLLAPRAALAGLIALTVALLLLLPRLLRGATALVGRLTRTARTPVPTLAVLELRAGATSMRTLALAATGAIAVFATVSIGGAHADLTRGLDAAAQEIDANADVWVTFAGGTSPYAATPLAVPTGVERALAGLPGVRSVARYRGSFLDVEDRRTWVQAPPRTAPALVPTGQLRDGDPALAQRRLRAGGWAILSEAVADAQRVGVGDRVRLPTPVPTTLRVAAISNNLGWPSGTIVLAAEDYARAWGSAAPSALQLRLAPGAAPAAVARAARAAIGGRVPAHVETQRERVARHVAAARDGLSRLTQIAVLVLVSAMLAMAAAMGATIWQRRPTFAGLKVHGFAEGELWRALLLESGILLGTACCVGAAFGLFGQLLLSRALATITGFPVVYSTAGLVALGILALVSSVAVAMLAVPGWLAVRVPPTPSPAA